MANRDLLQPFANADKNRDETFLIETSGFIYNKAAHVIMAMLMNYDRYKENFPHIEIFKGMSTYKIFMATRLFSSLEALNQMSKVRLTPDLPEEEVRRLIILFKETMFELEEVDTRKYMVMPIFTYSLAQILKERCGKKIYLCNSQRFTKWEVDYIREVFNHKLEKVELLTGDTYDLYCEHQSELTTIFINDIYTMNKLEKDLKAGLVTEETVNKQLFCLRVTAAIVKENAELGVYQYTCGDLIDQYEKNKIHISVMPTSPIDDNDTNKIII